jgi:DNA helicase HerA-like ATPase
MTNTIDPSGDAFGGIHMPHLGTQVRDAVDNDLLVEALRHADEPPGQTAAQPSRFDDAHPSQALVGLVDGSLPSSTRAFRVILNEDAVVSLDELVVTTQTLPGGGVFTHYGIVVEGYGEIEGADVASDTQRITGTRTMPGLTARTLDVQVLRTIPERWLPPAPGAVVARASGNHRDNALFLDQMTRQLPVGLDQNNEPLFADFEFINGTKGGHVSISGVSGVATKTSYAMFLLYILFETPVGRALLGHQAANTRALVFNVKGEDLLYLDRPNAALVNHPDAALQWAALGVDELRPFADVTIYAPRAAGPDDVVVPSAHSRPATELSVYGWTPELFIREGLLQFLFTEEDDTRTQIGMVEQRCRVQLARWAHPHATKPGAVVLRRPATEVSYVFDRLAAEHRVPVRPDASRDDVEIHNFADLVDFLSRKITDDDHDWTGGVQQATGWAFLRRLYAQQHRIGHLISIGVQRVALESAVTVVDISSLHDSAQRFVVGALLSRVFEEKAGLGREPLRFVVLDELNKYAPAVGRSPIKDVLVDIAARGRSLGVLLIGAQQAAGDVDGNITRNAAVKVVGRLDAGEADSYRFLTPAVRERAARFLPGTMVVDQPLIPAPLPMRFPFPPYATNVAEGARSDREVEQRGTAAVTQLRVDGDDPPPF